MRIRSAVLPVLILQAFLSFEASAQFPTLGTSDRGKTLKWNGSRYDAVYPVDSLRNRAFTGAPIYISGSRNALRNLFAGTGISVAYTDSGITITNTGGGGGGGITTLNTLTATTQTLAIGSSGADPAWTSSGSTHTLELPTASAVNRGVLSSSDWSTFNGKQATITGGATTITSSNLTASRALVSDVSGKVAVSSGVTSAEFEYLATTTSDVQTQLNGKQAAITGGATTIASSDLTASRALVSDVSGKVAVSSGVTSAELEYLATTTSDVQTQLNGKEGTLSAGTSSQYYRGDKSWQTLNQAAVSGLTTASTPTFANLTISAQAGQGAAYYDGSGQLLGLSSVSSTELGWLDGVTSSIQTQLNATTQTTKGGTGLTTNTANQIPYYDGVGTEMGVIPAAAGEGLVIRSTSPPSWGAVRLSGATIDVSGTLSTGNGGTNKTSWSANSVPFLTNTTTFSEDNADFSYDGTNKLTITKLLVNGGNSTTMFEAVTQDAKFTRSSTDAWGVYFAAKKTRGTYASPTACSNGDQIGAMQWNFLSSTAVERGGWLLDAEIDDVTNASEDVTGRMGLITAGTLTKYHAFTGPKVGLNTGSSADATSAYLKVVGADNAVTLELKIPATSANITSADHFIDFTDNAGTVIGSVAGTASSGVIAYNTFTGAHYVQQSAEGESIIEGMLVRATGELMPSRSTLPWITKTITRGDKAVFGVYAGKISNPVNQALRDSIFEMRRIKAGMDSLLSLKSNDSTFRGYDSAKAILDIYQTRIGESVKRSTDYNGANPFKAVHQVFALGVGKVLVTETGGNIEVGDLIWSSNRAGLGEKQPDDFVRSSSVAKATEPVDWSLVTVNAQGIKIKKISCTYLQ